MTEERVRVREVRVLSDDWYVLRKTTFDYRRRDGTWQTLSRETYDRGNGAAILPYDRSRGTVLLTRQFRYLAYVNGHPEPLVEAIAGLLDERSPEEAIRHEAEEGGRLPRRPAPARVRSVHVAWLRHRAARVLRRRIQRRGPRGGRGGVHAEGEDIEVLEPTLDEALAMVASGEIADGKTIMLLQYAKLHRLVD